jgi:hypothetical protein
VTGFVRIGLMLLGAAGFGAAYLWWSSPEREIRRVLDSVAEALSHDTPTSGLTAVSKVSSLQQYFSSDVTIEAGRPFPTVNGRDAVLAAAARLLSVAPALRVAFEDVQIDVADDEESAAVGCTAIGTQQDRAGQETVDARELRITMRLVDGEWVIAHARAIDVLEPVRP